MVRDATVDDAEAIAEVVVAAWRWAYSGFLPGDFLDRWCDPKRRAEAFRRESGRPDRMLVATDESRRVRGVAIERLTPEVPGYDAEIGVFYVHPDAAGQGLGSSLFGEMVRGFLARGCRSMAVQTLDGNRIGRGFYVKKGGSSRPAPDWNGFASVMYVWDEGAMRTLVA